MNCRPIDVERPTLAMSGKSTIGFSTTIVSQMIRPAIPSTVKTAKMQIKCEASQSSS